MVAKTDAASRTLQGFAAFLDLRDSTYAWNQNADLAEEMIGELHGIVEKITPRWKGTIGNFTGDGFLLLFSSIEPCIHAMSEIIDTWEPSRQVFLERYAKEGGAFPDALGLVLRTGVALGKYRRLGGWKPPQHAGEVINRAQRCETAARVFFENEGSPLGREIWRQVILTDDAHNFIQNKTDYDLKPLQVEQFKGYGVTVARAKEGMGQRILVRLA